MFVRKITSGHTYQDLLDAQPTPGAMFDRPDFMENVLLNYELAAAVDLDLADNESVKARVLDPGPHDIHAGRIQTFDRLDRPEAQWICAPLQVTDA